MAKDRLNDQAIRALFEDSGAIREGHFLLTSGRHAATYIQCAKVMESPKTTLALAEEAVARLPGEVRESLDLVVSPAVGGITFGFAMGLALGVNFIFSERVNGVMAFRRSFEVRPGSRVLVCEDVVTTGGSVQEVIELVEAAGGNVVGVVSLIDRKTNRVFDAPFWPLLSFEVPSWEAAACPLCAEGGEAESLGSRTLA